MTRRTVLAMSAGALIAFLTIMLLALFTDPGRRVTGRVGFWTLGRLTGFTVRCGDFNGDLFTAFTCTDFTVADSEGVFARGRTLYLDWSVAPILRRRVAIDTLRISDAVVTRAPAQEPDPQPFSLPAWPAVGIDIASLRLERIALRFPERPQLCFGGGGSVSIVEPVVALDTRFARCGGEGSLRAMAAYREGRLTLDAAGEDDGAIANFLFGWEGAGATQLRIAGAGPLEDFSGTLDAEVSAAATAMLRVNSRPLGPDGELIATVSGAVALAEGRAPAWAPARDGEISARIAVTNAGGFRVHDGILRWGGSELRFAFALSAEGGAIAGEVDATLGSLGETVAFDSGQVRARLSGTRTAPAVGLTYRFAALRAGDSALGRLDGTAALALDRNGTRLVFETEADAEDIALAEFLDTAVGDGATVIAEGAYVFADSALAIEAVLRTDHSALTLEGDLALDDGFGGSGSAELVLEKTARIAGVSFPGGATVRLTADDIALAGRSSGSLEIDSPMLAADGTVLRAADGALSGRFATTRTNPELLSQATGLTFTGAPRVTLVAGGSLAEPQLAFGFAVPRVARGELVFSDVEGEAGLVRRGELWASEVQLSSTTSAGPLQLAADVTWGAAQPVRIALGDTTLFGAVLEGEVSAASWGAPWVGRLGLHERPLAPVAALTGSMLSGAGNLEFTFAAERERQRIAVAVDVTDMSYGALLTNAALEGEATYVEDGAVAADLQLTEGPNTLTLAADGTVGEATAVLVRRLDGEWRDVPVRLVAPAPIRVAGETFALGPAQFRIDEGRLVLAAERSGAALSARAELSELPAAPVAALFEWPGEVEGTLAGTAAVAFMADTAEGRAALSADDIAFASDARGLEPADLSVTADWNGRTLALEGQIGGIGNAPARLTATLPLLRQAGGYGATFPEHGPVSGRFTGTARAERLFALLPLPEHRLTGLMSVSLAVSGDIAAPRISGRAALEDGTYESLELGTQLRDLDLALTATPAGALQIRGAATDGGAGRFALSGNLALVQNHATVDAVLETVNADLVRTDEYLARGSARLALVRGRDGPARVTGSVRTTELRFDLGRPLPAGVQEIAVIEINRPPELGAAAEPEQSPEVIRTTVLQIDVDMPNRVFVTGYGVDAEWRGDIDVRGTLGDPVIDGRLELIRGEAELLGRAFALEQGTVTLDPFAPGNARLRIVAAHEQQGLTVRVTAEGSADAPRLTWTSTPALPRDEILSRVYFGRASPSLNAYEAVQLAQLAGVFGGVGGGGILGFARQVTGFDVLRLEGPVEGADGGPRIAVGKYITDNIYVGAVTGADTSSGALQVEIQVTPNIAVQAETGADARNSVGVVWEHDY